MYGNPTSRTSKFLVGSDFFSSSFEFESSFYHVLYLISGIDSIVQAQQSDGNTHSGAVDHTNQGLFEVDEGVHKPKEGNNNQYTDKSFLNLVM